MENDSTRNLRVNPDADSDDVTAHVQAPETEDFRAAFVAKTIVEDEDVEGHFKAKQRVPVAEDEDVEGHFNARFQRVPLTEEEDVEGHFNARFQRVPLTEDEDTEGFRM